MEKLWLFIVASTSFTFLVLLFFWQPIPDISSLSFISVKRKSSGCHWYSKKSPWRSEKPKKALNCKKNKYKQYFYVDRSEPGEVILRKREDVQMKIKVCSIDAIIYPRPDQSRRFSSFERVKLGKYKKKETFNLNNYRSDFSIFEIKCRIKLNGSKSYIDHSEVFYSIRFNHELERIKRHHANTDGSKQPNLLWIVQDALSRLGTHANLPKTRDIMKELDFVELMKYHAVGENSWPNAVPLLTGKSEDRIAAAALRAGLTVKKWTVESEIGDNIANQLNQNGYFTGYSEDEWFTIFHYGRNGFGHVPFDYYMNLFYTALRNEYDHETECVGNETSFAVQMDMMNQFIDEYAGRGMPWFYMMWQNTLTHDSASKLKNTADMAYSDFFDSLSARGVLNNTIIVFQGDHGQRWTFSQIDDKQSEQFRPAAFIRFPASFDTRKLKQNAKSFLTTPMDIHETLRTAMDIHIHNGYNLHRFGVSLLDNDLPDRSCSEADVPAHLCTCDQWFDAEKKFDKNKTEEIQNRTLASLQSRAQRINDRAGKNATICSSWKKISNIKYIQHRFDGDDEYIRLLVTAYPCADFLFFYKKSGLEGGEFEELSAERIDFAGAKSSCLNHVEAYKIEKLFCWCEDYSGSKKC